MDHQETQEKPEVNQAVSQSEPAQKKTQKKPEVNQAASQSEPSYMQIKKPSQREPATQNQRDSVITEEDLPNPFFRAAVTLALFLPLLFVAAIYYGILKI